MINAINPAIRLINRFGQVLIAVLAGKNAAGRKIDRRRVSSIFPVCESGFGPLTEAAYMINSMQSALASWNGFISCWMRKNFHRTRAPRCCGSSKRNGRISECPVWIYAGQNLNGTISISRKTRAEGCNRRQYRSRKTTLINLLMRFYELNGE